MLDEVQHVLCDALRQAAAAAICGVVTAIEEVKQKVTMEMLVQVLTQCLDSRFLYCRYTAQYPVSVSHGLLFLFHDLLSYLQYNKLPLRELFGHVGEFFSYQIRTGSCMSYSPDGSLFDVCRQVAHCNRVNFEHKYQTNEHEFSSSSQ
jgi:hypothetical protein